MPVVSAPVTAQERLLRARDAIEERADLNAFISLTDETGDGDVVAVKDIMDVRGTVTTGGGTLLNRQATDDAAPVARVREHGCVVVGKANLHEWAYGVTSRNPHYGPVRNPADPERIAGGSSGGSAAAVAAGMCNWSIGTDTGGSIRIPAALCGVVGLKPTLGAIDSTGVFPLSRTLDTVGPIAPDVATTQRAWEMLAGEPSADGTREPRLAVPAGWVHDLDRPTQAAWERVSAGLPEIAFPDPAQLARVGDLILAVEAATLHARWVQEHPDAYGDDVLTRLRAGMQVPAVEYLHGLEERRAMSEAVEAALDGVDAVLTPATPCVAPRLEEPVTPGLLTRFTRPFNTTGHPVVCLPAPSESLPVGIQVVGRKGREAALLRIAAELEDRWRT